MSREIITSVQNPRVKQVGRLRDRRQRERQGRYVIDGARELLRALRAGVPLEEGFICEPLCRSEESRQAAAALAQVAPRLVHVTEPVFARLAFGERSEGVLAVAPLTRRGLSELELPANPIVAILEGIEKPGNLGAVLRSADGVGVSAVIVTGGTDLYNPNTIRASLGTIFTLAVVEATSEETLAWLLAQGIAVYAARVDAQRLYTEVDYRGAAAIALGSEAQGLSRLWESPQVTAIRLPMRGVADSLNVSAAAAVLFYEALRQREAPPGQ